MAAKRTDSNPFSPDIAMQIEAFFTGGSPDDPKRQRDDEPPHETQHPLKRVRGVGREVDEDSCEAEEIPFLASECWDWYSLQPCPKQVACDENIPLLDRLDAIRQLYGVFPDSVPLGDTAQSNDIRALHARGLWHMVRSLPRPLLRSSQLPYDCTVHIGPKWRERLDMLIAGRPLAIQERFGEQCQVMRTLKTVHGVGKVYAYKFAQQGIRSIDDLKQQPHLLTSAQALGVQHYDHLQQPIPRIEAETWRQLVADAVG
jgi:hypothetical protein